MTRLAPSQAGARVPALLAWALVAAAVLGISPAPLFAKIILPPEHSAGQPLAEHADVTVVLADGWKLPGATVRWSESEAGLWVARPDGARRLYHPHEVRAVHRADGSDLTAAALPGWVLPHLAGGERAGEPLRPASARSSPPPAVATAALTAGASEADQRPTGVVAATGAGPAASDAPAPGRWHAWQFLFGFAAGYSAPHEDDLLESGGGLGFDARARLRLLGPFYLAGGFAWQGLSRQGHADLRLAVPDAAVRDVPGGEPPDATVAGFWAGLALIPAAREPQGARFYAEGGVGRYEVQNLPLQTADEAFLGWNGGVGLLMPVGDTAVIDVGARFLHLVNLDLGGDEDRHTTLGLRIGIDLLAR